MGESESIVAIYQYLDLGVMASEVPEQLEASYYLTYVFDNNGPVDDDVLASTYDEMMVEGEERNSGQFIGPFSSLSILNKYAFNLCERMDAKEISLLSVKEYNGVLEQVNSTSELFSSLISAGNRIENIDRDEKRKGILGKIFT